MAFILLLLAALAAGAAAILWRMAAAQEAAESVDESTENPSADASDSPADASDDIFAGFSTVDEQEPPATPESEPEPEPEPEQAPEPAPEPEPEAESVTPAPAAPVRHLPSLPGAVRRERKAWAEERGYEYSKTDPYLVDEFTRGAAASGAAPRDIVAGNEFNHEMLLMDLGGTGVMAMRTGSASDTVVDFRRAAFAASGESHSDDLFEVSQVEGFSVFATEASVAQRFIDPRVEIALQNMPEDVTAVWTESDWVLAQTTKHARGETWTAMLAPLALLADAARVLPPRSTAKQALRPEDTDPTRLIPPPELPEPTGPVLVPSLDDEYAHPPVTRPEAPSDMPSRRTGDVRGSMEHSAIGADEVDAIADGRERPQPDANVARVPRDLSKGSSIFDEDSR